MEEVRNWAKSKAEILDDGRGLSVFVLQFHRINLANYVKFLTLDKFCIRDKCLVFAV